MRMLVGPARVWAGAGGGNPPDPGNPLDLPLVTEETFSAAYEGYFSPPDSFEYGGSGLAVSADGDSLYCTGHLPSTIFGRMTIPGIGQKASAEVEPVYVPGQTMDPEDATQGFRVFGALVHDGRLILVPASYYEGPMVNWCQSADLDLTSFGSINGMTTQRGASIRALSAGLGHLPPEWHSIFGGSAFAFGGSMQQVALASCGPAFGVFDPDDVSDVGGTVSMNDLLYYTEAHPIEPFSPSTYPEDYVGYNSSGGTDYFAIQTLPTGTAFIYPGSRSLLFVYGHGYGPYGNNTGCYGGSSVFSGPYRLQVVAYDLRELKKVQDGQLLPYEVQPYDWWLLGPDDYGGLGVCVDLLSGSFTFDIATKKLYGARYFSGGLPSPHRINVWQIGELI